MNIGDGLVMSLLLISQNVIFLNIFCFFKGRSLTNFFVMKVRREDGLKDTIVDAPTWWGLANGGFMREDAI